MTAKTHFELSFQGAVLLVVLGALPRAIAQSAPANTFPAPSISVERLTVEEDIDPVGIDALEPRLGWMLRSSRRGDVQTAYRVLVASTPDALREGAADAWDSGRVVSDRSIDVPYRGRDLRSSEKLHWTVRVWDRDGRPSAWAAPGAWTMAIVHASDWKARWIRFGWSEDKELRLDPASWIWTDEGPSFPSAADGVPPGTRWFVRDFDLGGGSIARAALIVAADNEYEVTLNGRVVGRGDDWRRAGVYDAGPFLRAGKTNRIIIRATNTTASPSPAGVLARLSVEGAAPLDLATDGRWTGTREATIPAEANAEIPGARPVRVAARFGGGPWGRAPAMTKDFGPLPIVRKEFSLERAPVRALIHVSGLGHYVLMVNGHRVGDRFLDPAWTLYEKTAPYTTYDVTGLLDAGGNAIGVMIGKGFYNTVGNRRIHGVVATRPLTLRLQLDLFGEGGVHAAVSTDASWRFAPGPITHEAVHGGIDYDARRLPEGWDRPGFDDASWTPAIEWTGPVGVLRAHLAPPMKVMEEFRPQGVDEPEPGRFVYDFGQNCSSVPRLRVQGPAGATLRLVHAEQRHGPKRGWNVGTGRVDQAGIGTPQYFQYTLKGGGVETWDPEFYYSGFQYVEIEGAAPAGRPNPTGLPTVVDLVSRHVRSAAETIGTFSSSSDLLNRIDRLVDWSVKSNLAHVLTDCPHREKLGWLEVSYLMGPSIAFRYDLSRLYAKVARDIRDSQQDDGIIRTVAPDYANFGGGFDFTTEWGAAGVMVPWILYRYYGDERALSDNYEMMKRFVDALAGLADRSGILPATGLGDWYDYGHGEAPGPSRFTPTDLTATATWSLCAEVVRKTASILRRPESETQAYSTLVKRIREAFRNRFFDRKSATFTNHGSPQAGSGIAIAAGMLDRDEIPRAVNAIVADVRARKNQQTAGDVGHVYLLRALAENGRSDVIYDMTNRRTLGSYGHIIDAGWTSLPESWDADPSWSMQHCMLGHILEWFQEYVGGIRLDDDVPGYRAFRVRPEPVGDLSWATVTHRSPYGDIRSAWRRDGTSFFLDIEVPVGTTATVEIPSRALDAVREGGIPVADGITPLRFEAGRAILRVESGAYRLIAATR